MQKLNFEIVINAPVKKVWETMLNEESYKQWTKPFSGNSYFVGSWEEGKEMKFLGLDPETGKTMGMYSKIKVLRPLEFVSIEHLGMISDDKIDTTSEEVKKWIPAFENYKFESMESATKLSIELDTPDEYKEMFEGMWPESLKILKELSEKK